MGKSQRFRNGILAGQTAEHREPPLARRFFMMLVLGPKRDAFDKMHLPSPIVLPATYYREQERKTD